MCASETVAHTGQKSALRLPPDPRRLSPLALHTTHELAINHCRNIKQNHHHWTEGRQHPHQRREHCPVPVGRQCGASGASEGWGWQEGPRRGGQRGLTLPRAGALISTGAWGGGGGAGHPGQAKVWASVVKDAAFSGGVCQPVRSAPTHPGGQGCELLVPQAPPKHPWKANWRITSDSPVGSPWRRRAEPVRERALSGG